ncbi:MAG: hypothetical protein H6618_05935 [Deltaproteobacteria bacterium]|nr:hypothetical protein [Deltaproteobacteria bacterium]
MMFRLLSAASGIIMILIAVLLEGGNVSSLAMFTAFLYILGGVSGALCISFSPDEIKRSLMISLKKTPAKREQYHRALSMFDLLEKSAIISGLTGFICGFIHTMDTAEVTGSIMPGLSVSAVSVLYALCICLFISSPLKNNIGFRLKTGNFSGEEQNH